MTERQIGGLWCHEVLELLDAYVDGSLNAKSLASIQAHTAECDNCARFGSAYAAVVSSLRSGSAPDSFSPARAERLAARLAEESR